MSLRVQNDASAGVGSPDVSRAAQTGSTAPGFGRSRTSSSAAGGDQVQVSSVAESIAAGATALSQERASRVSQLSALYAGGKYTVDSARVSAALVATATTPAAAGKA